jgi:protein ImuA
MPLARNSAAVGETVQKMNRLLQRLDHSGKRSGRERIGSGCPPLDRLLPQRGFARGSLVEWLADGPGSGASMLALVAAREACRQGGVLVVVDRQGTFYPPAAAAWRIDLQSMIVVRPQNDKDEQWTLDQALRCEHVAAVMAWPQRLDGHTFRRLQLAAETSGSLGLLVRPLSARREPSWANVRLLISPRREKGVGPHLPGAGKKGAGPICRDGPEGAAHKLDPSPFSRRLRVQLLRCRGRFGGNATELEIDHQTGEIHETHPGNLASQLVRPAASEHSA